MRFPRHERGSAYLVALMVLLLLTLLGLSVTAVSQTEMVLGANEKMLERVFYAAESGLAISSARALVSNDRRPAELSFDDTPETAADGKTAATGETLHHELELSAFYPVVDVPCNLCQINNQGTYSEEAFRKVDHAVTVRASRAGIGGEIAAQKTLSAVIGLQPWRVSTDAYAIIDEPDELAKIEL